MLKQKQENPMDEHVSVSVIHSLSGITDEDAIKAILVTGASKKEIQLACDYSFENLHVKPSSLRPMSRCVRNVLDILDYSRDFLD